MSKEPKAHPYRYEVTSVKGFMSEAVKPGDVLRLPNKRRVLQFANNKGELSSVALKYLGKADE